MNGLKKHDTLLFSGFIILIVLIIIMSLTGGYALFTTNTLFKQVQKTSFVGWMEAEQAKADLIDVHRAMKDVVLSKTDLQLASALKNVDKYDTEINQHFASIQKIDTDNPFVIDLIRAYKDWAPIRANTIAFTKNLEYERAAENTRTEGETQVNLISEKMQLLIKYEKEKAESAYQSSEATLLSSLSLLFWLTCSAIIIALYYYPPKVTKKNKLFS